MYDYFLVQFGSYHTIFVLCVIIIFTLEIITRATIFVLFVIITIHTIEFIIIIHCS